MAVTTVPSSLLGPIPPSKVTGLEDAWLVPSFNAADFTGTGGMTWTVDSGDIIEYAYRVIGKTMFLNYSIGSTTLSGTQEQFVKIKIPGGYTAKRTGYIPVAGISGGVNFLGIAGLTGSDSWVKHYRSLDGATLFPNGTNNVSVYGNLVFEIN